LLLAGGAAAVRGQSALDGFDPNANGAIRVVVVEPDTGKILIGGDFTSLSPNGGVPVTRNHIARLNSNGSVDSAFDPNANGTVYSIAVQPDGKILAGGAFFGANSIGGATRNRIARLDPITGAADSFDPNANNDVYSITLQADGKILVGGAFLGTNSIGGATRNHIARLDATTGVPDSFDANANNDVRAIVVQPNGKILAGGLFNTIGGQTRRRIARLDATSGLADSFNPNANNSVLSIALQADGHILAGGSFNGANSIGGAMRNYIARLDATTGNADSFDPNASTIVNALALQPDGRILAGGLFTTIGGATRNHIARLDPASGLADSFDPNAGLAALSIAVQMDGKILVAGDFTTLAPSGGAIVTRNHIARLEMDGRLDQTLDLSTVGSYVLATAVQPGGKILIGGSFNTVLGVTRNNIARLNTDGTLDTAFNPNANGDVYSIAVQADGKILAGGTFQGANSIGGQTRNYIARLDATTGAADSFNPNANDIVRSIAVQADGKILAGGHFITIGGQSRNFFARLTNDTAALQNLAATQTAITWTRGGSSPQFTRVIFESSTDNVNYSALGNGTASGSNWTLTGLNLPTGQNIYVRARGYYRSGYFNGSENITESVRNVFITLPPTPTAVVSRKEHGGAGIFDINLPLSGNPGIECRSGGAGNDYQMIFTFPGSVTFTNAAVTAGTGSVSASSGTGTSTIIISLTGVTNAQTVTVTLFGASDGTNTANLSVQMAMLLGDTTGNGTVNASDVSQTKSKSGQAVDASNFRTDVTVNGSINASDVSLVKSRSGTALP